MISFILNEQIIETNAHAGMALLDFIRNDQLLKGSKLVCKEGECGACSVLIGEVRDSALFYQSMTSCITPLINAHGKHVVTIEGLNMDELTPVQRAMVDEYGTQCGFCTPGFVVSLTGYLMNQDKPSIDGIIGAIDGNICRCTGYKGIERAAKKIFDQLNKVEQPVTISTLVNEGFIPCYFNKILRQLEGINTSAKDTLGATALIGGGTDLYVQRPWEMYDAEVTALYDIQSLKKIEIKDDLCIFGASLTMGDLYRSKVFKSVIPDSDYIFKLLSSTQIRNMATIGGNLVNASPIGDFTIILLALDSDIILKKEVERRTVSLKDFYKGYKKIDLKEGEILEKIQFKVPSASSTFHFEKVSQRKYFDIASVNLASKISIEDEVMTEVHLAVGGVGPIPLYLRQTSTYLIGKRVNEETIKSAIKILNGEVSPISDARGSSDYKRLLARQLFIAQFFNLKGHVLHLEKMIG